MRRSEAPSRTWFVGGDVVRDEDLSVFARGVAKEDADRLELQKSLFFLTKCEGLDCLVGLTGFKTRYLNDTWFEQSHLCTATANQCN